MRLARKNRSLWSIVCLLLLSSCTSHLSPRQTEQVLFVALDAVPYSLMKELYEEGHFQNFQKPVRLISAFPSTTTSCLTGIFRPLGAGRSPGYDAKFFSYADNKIVGNLLEAYDIGGVGYKHFFDLLRSSGFEQVVMYSVPSFAAHADLARLKEKIWNSPKKSGLFFYVGSTDATAHLDGKEATKALILLVSKKIEMFREQYKSDFGKELKIVYFSDHGFYWDQMKPVDVGDLGRRLKARGLQLAETLEEPKNVAAITWGNISGGDLYAAPQLFPDIISVLEEIPGIDLIALPKDKKIIVYGKREKIEKSAILFDEKGTQFAYQPVTGDPLHYAGLVSGFASKEAWFAKTKDLQYPDALYRLWDAFFGLVENKAGILVSTKEDYEFGDNWTRLGAKMRGGLLGTHGALAENSSAAFLMTNIRDVSLPDAVRYDEALLPFLPLISE